MRKTLFTILFLLLVPVLVSCGPSKESGYHGYLYFAKGRYLVRFSLRDSSISVVTNLGAKTIRNISAFGEDKLLIAETVSINQKNISRISWVDLKTGQSEALYSGVIARHLANTDLIVYDDGGKLYAVSLAGDSNNDRIILSHRLHQLSAMIEASNDILLIETSEHGQRVINSYHAVTGEVRTLDRLSAVCRLEGAVWIDDLEKLACREHAVQGRDAVYILAGLDGVVHGDLGLPEGKRFLALTYITDQSALILRESWNSAIIGQKKSAVWVHDVHSGKSQRLAKNQNLGASVVYTDF